MKIITKEGNIWYTSRISFSDKFLEFKDNDTGQRVALKIKTIKSIIEI